jgi:hypothetical protein
MLADDDDIITRTRPCCMLADETAVNGPASSHRQLAAAGPRSCGSALRRGVRIAIVIFPVQVRAYIPLGARVRNGPSRPSGGQDWTGLNVSVQQILGRDGLV